MSDVFAERGTCPRCGSEQVVHVLFGMPAPGASEQAPEWVEFGGCVVWPDARDRRCQRCDHAWSATEAPTADAAGESSREAS